MRFHFFVVASVYFGCWLLGGVQGKNGSKVMIEVIEHNSQADRLFGAGFLAALSRSARGGQEAGLFFAHVPPGGLVA